MLRKILENVLDVILPPVCANCGAPISGNEKDMMLCRNCALSVIIRKAPVKMGSFLLFAAAGYAEPPIRNLIKILKYGGIIDASRPLSEFVFRHLEISGFMNAIPPDSRVFIVPVPIYFAKKFKRGFDQSEEMAKLISERVSIPVARVLRRKKATLPQSNMKNENSRSLNVKDCFRLERKEAVKIPKRSVIILFDDIITSGSTMKEAAKALRPLCPSKILLVCAASRLVDSGIH